MHILGLPTDIFNVYPASVKYKTYQARWQIGDIYVSGDARKTEDNPQGLGCYLVMTGRGCDDIFRILDSRNYTFGDMFRHCERRYGLDNFHFTRLDIAIDDKNEKPFFTIEQIKKKCEKEEFISNSEGYHFDESKFDDFDTAKTVYIGAGKSEFIVLPLEKPCNIRRFRLSNPQTVCTFPCFFPYGLKQGKDFYSPLTTLSSSRAELRFASLVEWA